MRFRTGAKTISQPDHDQCANDDQRSRHNHEGPEKFLDAVIEAKTSAADEPG